MHKINGKIIKELFAVECFGSRNPVILLESVMAHSIQNTATNKTVNPIIGYFFPFLLVLERTAAYGRKRLSYVRSHLSPK